MPNLTITNHITILGAGLIGLSQALVLLQNNFTVTIIDKHIHPDKKIDFNPDVFDMRVLALTPETSAFLQTLEVWGDIVSKRVCPYAHMIVWDGKGSSQITFDALSLGVPILGHIVEQNIIIQALLAKLKYYLDNGQLTWLVKQPIELSRDNPDIIGIKLSDETIIYSRLLVGADGADSWLRSQAGLPVTFKYYEQSAIVATIHCEKNHQNTAYQRFGEGGPLALLPLSDPNKISIVWTQPSQISENLLALIEPEFNHALTQCSENILGNLRLVGVRKSFMLKSLQAQSYGSDRIVLVGDSAHVIHPLAGLGANLGFQDVIALSALLIKQGNNQRDLGSNQLIQRYYRERIAKNEAVRHSMTTLNKLFMSQNPLIKLIRNWGLDKTNGLPKLKKWFAHQAMGLS